MLSVSPHPLSWQPQQMERVTQSLGWKLGSLKTQRDVREDEESRASGGTGDSDGGLDEDWTGPERNLLQRARVRSSTHRHTSCLETDVSGEG